jgi:serine/threonine protein kinase
MEDELGHQSAVGNNAFVVDDGGHHYPVRGSPTGTNGSDPLSVTSSGHARLRILRGNEIGRGAFGVVYQALRVSDGVMLALKQLPLGASKIDDSVSLSGGSRQVSVANITSSVSANDGGDDDAIMSQPSLPQSMAKVISSSLTNTAHEASPSIVAEINMLRRLRHQNIISYYGCTVNQEEGIVSILMELAPKSLKNIIDEFGGSLPDKLIAVYARQALSGITYLHNHHIVHRDIKAANILVTSAGETKVSDFGAAMVAHSFAQGTEQDPSAALTTVQGTPAFIAPEVLAGSMPLEPSDMWSFGGLLLEMATGRPPWHEEGHESLVQIAFSLLVLQQPPAIPARIENPSLRDIITRCLAMDPCARPSALELLTHPFLAADADDEGQ